LKLINEINIRCEQDLVLLLFLWFRRHVMYASIWRSIFILL